VAARKPIVWPLRVWVVGDARREEFRACIEQIVARTVATLYPDWPNEYEEEAEPDLCIVLGARPGEFGAEAIESLRHWAPLTRVVGLLGPWCEGEVRTGRPWPAVPRIYWHRWQAWFEGELAAWERGEGGTLSLPLTATDEERLLHPDFVAKDFPGLAVAISSASREMTGMLVEACAALGCHARSYAFGDTWTHEQRTIGIYDAAACDAEMIEEFRELAVNCPAAHWLVLANFPRPEDERRLREAGAAAVLSKPLVIDEFYAALGRLVVVGSNPARQG
jgi:CheY-like chemotaxis protein